MPYRTSRVIADGNGVEIGFEVVGIGPQVLPDGPDAGETGFRFLYSDIPGNSMNNARLSKIMNKIQDNYLDSRVLISSRPDDADNLPFATTGEVAYTGGGPQDGACHAHWPL